MAYCEEMIAYITAMSEEQGYTYADFLEAQEYTESSFLEYLYNDLSPEIVTEELIFAAVCAKEGISNTISDDEYAIRAEEYALYYGYDTVADLESALGKDAVKEMLVVNNVTKQLADKITITNK